MGLERIATVLQGVISNYQTDIFTPLLARASELTNFRPATAIDGRHSERSEESPHLAEIQASSRPTNGSGETPAFAFDPAWALSDAKGFASLRIIADHARAATFLISDGVLPANEGRRLRPPQDPSPWDLAWKAAGAGEQPFMHQMVRAVRDEMKTAYPELEETTSRIAMTVFAEEEQFARVIATASRYYRELILETKRSDVQSMLQTSPWGGLLQEAYEKQFPLRESDPSYRNL